VLFRDVLLNTRIHLRHDAFEQIDGVAGCPKKHKTWQAAFNEYKAKYDAGETQVKTQK
jgi:hypothetical protein